MMVVLLWRLPVFGSMIASRKSVTRLSVCRKKRLPPPLKQVHQLLITGVQATAALWPPLQHAYCFLDQARAILANESQETGQHIRERYLAHLAQMRGNLTALGSLAEPFEHFCHITENFAAGLF